MKIQSHDINGYPLNIDFSNFYISKEVFIDMPSHMAYLGIDYTRYMISNWGRIFNKDTNNYIPRDLMIKNNEYRRICLKGLNGNDIFISMHRLMGCVYFGIQVISNWYVINHKDGVKWHNELYNLEWVTSSENIKHADKNGLIARPSGEHNGNANLSDEQYHRICQLTQDGYKASEINKIMNCGIDITNIAQKIRTGTSETIISSQYDFSNIPKNRYTKFNINDIPKICKMLENKCSYSEILNSLGYNTKSIDIEELKNLKNKLRLIKNRSTYSDISKDYNF